MNSHKLIQLVSKIRVSEVRKHKCGNDLITFYNKVRKEYGM